ncbi:MAG: ribosome silencing factor [Bacteroidia bacterium]
MVKAKKKAVPAKAVTKKKVTSSTDKAPKKAAVVKGSGSKKAPTKAAKKAVKKTVKAVKSVKSTKKPATPLLKKAQAGPPAVKTQADRIADAAIHGILEKKGRNITCMNLKKVGNAVSDYFIICEADSTRQVAAIADSVDAEVKKATGENPFHTEGWENSLWILLDYVNVVVHVFEAETRHFYRLESLWADAEVKEYGVEYA